MNKEYKSALEDMKMIGVPSWHLITWHKCTLYDTTQDVKEYEVKAEIEHIEVACNDPKHPKCDYVMTKHKLK